MTSAGCGTPPRLLLAERRVSADGVEIAGAVFHIAEHLLKPRPAVPTQSAPTLVAIDPYDLHVVSRRIG